MPPVLQRKARETVVKQKSHKPRGGLITLFVFLLLATACSTGNLILSVDKMANHQMSWQQMSKILFLSAAYQLPYQDMLAESNNRKPDYIAGTEDGASMNDLTGRTLVLVNEDGSLLDNSYDYTNAYHSDKVRIQWKDGVACFLYNEEMLMVEKYKVTIYDYEHLDGGAAAQGSFGYPFNASDKLDDVLNNTKIGTTGDMYIFIYADWAENKRYLISFNKKYETNSQQVYSGQEPMLYDDALRREAKNLLGFGFLLFLALYWLGLAYWVYLDARRRMMRADAWTIAVFITNIAGFAGYLLAARTKARREAAKTCEACGGSMLRAYPRCPWCGEPQEKRCPACGAQMKEGWTVCPHCDGILKASEPEPQAPVEPPAIVPEPIVVLPKEEARAPKQEEEAAIPLIFQDGSPFNHN